MSPDLKDSKDLHANVCHRTLFSSDLGDGKQMTFREVINVIDFPTGERISRFAGVQCGFAKKGLVPEEWFPVKMANGIVDKNREVTVLDADTLLMIKATMQVDR